MKSNFFKYLLVFFGLLFAYSCSSVKIPEKAQTVATEFQNDPFRSNPRFLKGKLTVKIKYIGRSNDNFVNVSPSVLLWSSNIIDSYNQKVIKKISYSFMPTDVFKEKENGNEIAFWNLTDLILKKDSIKIERNFSVVTFRYSVKADSQKILHYWNKIPQHLKKFYTKKEPFLEQTKGMRDTLKKIISGINNPLNKAKKIFLWVRKTMQYVYPPKKRGAVAAFLSRKGDCGQYSALFITMCRIAGIPARQKSGFHFTLKNNGSHVWSEIYLPPYGWVPVDATRKNGFGEINNDVISASTGMNIPLKHAPIWANYSNSELENGRTDFMQMGTLASRGIMIKISISRKVIESKNLN